MHLALCDPNRRDEKFYRRPTSNPCVLYSCGSRPRTNSGPTSISNRHQSMARAEWTKIARRAHWRFSTAETCLHGDRRAAGLQIHRDDNEMYPPLSTRIIQAMTRQPIHKIVDLCSQAARQAPPIFSCFGDKAKRHNLQSAYVLI